TADPTSNQRIRRVDPSGTIRARPGDRHAVLQLVRRARALHGLVRGRSPLLAVSYDSRDAVGRITQKTETIGGATTVYVYDGGPLRSGAAQRRLRLHGPRLVQESLALLPRMIRPLEFGYVRASSDPRGLAQLGPVDRAGCSAHALLATGADFASRIFAESRLRSSQSRHHLP